MNPNVKMSAEDALTRAVTQLLVHNPFFGNLAMRLTRIEAAWQPTMATDGKHMFWNRDYVDACTPQEAIAAVAHEVMHCAMQHFLRKGNRDPLRMNLGGDMAINTIIRDAGLTLSSGVVFPATFQLPEGQWMEWYADHLPPQITSKCGGGPNGPCQGVPGGSGPACTEQHAHGGCGGVMPLPGKDGGPSTQSEQSQAASDWQIATTQAAQAAKAAGKLPSALDRFVTELNAPSVDWRDVLRRFVSATVRDDYRMFPPNRRFISSGLYMPSMRSDAIGEVLFVVDSSGSIGGEEFRAFASEAASICEEVRPTNVQIIYHATSVHGHEQFTPDEYPIVFKTDESGGTNFQCVIDYCEENGIDPVCCVWFTDMYPDHWPSEPPFPVLWAATTDIDGPFGETIRIKVPEAA